MKIGLVVTLLAVVLISPSQAQQSISIENVEAVAILQQLTFENATFRDLVIQPASERLVVAVRQREDVSSLNGQVVFIDSQQLQQLPILNEGISANALAFSPDGSLFATGTEKGDINVFDTQTWEIYATFDSGVDIVNDLAISEDNRYLGATFAIPTIVHEGDIAFRLFSFPDGQVVVDHPRETDVYGGGIAFDMIEQHVFFSTNDYAQNSSNIYTAEIATGRIEKVAIANSPNTRQLVYNSENQALYSIGQARIQVTFPFAQETSLDFVIEMQNEEEMPMTLALHPNQPILAVGFFIRTPRPDGGPSATNAGIIRLYQSETGEELISLDVPEGAITHLAFSPDGALLASGGMDGTVRLWGVAGE